MSFFIKIYDYLTLAISDLKALLSKFYRFSFVRIFFILFLIVNISLWIFSYFIFDNITQDRLILHYNVDIGIDLIGGRSDIFIVPLLSLILIFLNKIFLLFFLKRRTGDFKFVFYFTASFLLLTQLFLLLSVLLVYLINFK
ncbi:hypothetical protein CVU82_02590 [Candidatus Falkowbacteria bacterium HGW-Falkowbacteria-1]|jgi:hypothetical protein|uniref:DUF1648 domain-containing protein n=1 Tax=Candidatus Falkowbacteria bacterium HGW-Falkowbacteria-1 TaxID=2013768 RepID=A0A2N2E9P9_9BACT|nr:MAG: hypothetical protein CVU82_02590 [Candidatus Falkowbacteria bacterium HGW-Falkowbacteria-1]